jgi:biofilm PGA synthesis N-glycosyltransferase PgaC
MWLLAVESVGSLLWVLALAAAILIAILQASIDGGDVLGFGLGWGVAISVLATIQVTVALWVETDYDPRAWRAYLVEPIYPLVFWLFSALAALRAQTVGVVRGPRSERVKWDIAREQA